MTTTTELLARIEQHGRLSGAEIIDSGREFTTITTRANAFGRIETIECTVDSDGTVRVWDSVAGYYTTCHRLSESAIRRIRRLAREVR